MSRYDREKCSVDDCDRYRVKSFVPSRNPNRYCILHLNRWRRYGHIGEVRQPRGYGRHKNMDGYVKINVNGQYVYEHIYLAEKALGKKLPKKARVHHINEIRDDNYTPFNLVICPTEGYHQLLHRRMKEVR